VYGDPPDFAIADREQALIFLALCGEPERIVPNWRIVDKIWNAYIRVDDVEAVCAEVQERGAGIDYTIYNAPSGFREFGVQETDGHDIAFGQPLWASACRARPEEWQRPLLAAGDRGLRRRE
jgi:hypothetical protein